MSYPNCVEYLSSSLELSLSSLQLLISISILIPRAPLSSPYCPSYNLLSPPFKSPQLYQCPKHQKNITQTLINRASPKYKSICLTRIRARSTKNRLISSNKILTKIKWKQFLYIDAYKELKWFVEKLNLCSFWSIKETMSLGIIRGRTTPKILIFVSTAILDGCDVTRQTLKFNDQVLTNDRNHYWLQI